MPYTVNEYLNVPNTGDLPGSWGTTAVNANMSAIDGKLGGFVSISITSATTLVLSVPAGALTGLTPGAGPTQSQNALIKFTGQLTGNSTVSFVIPGYYIVHNACTSSAFYSIKLAPQSGGGNVIGAPPGRKCHIFYDGTDVDYVDMPEVGSALDLHGVATTPVWMQACTVRPYLVKDGSTAAIATYPHLFELLGTTFGGDGATSFGLPDERNRARLAIDLSVAGATAGRITAATGGAGVIGTAMGTSGGSQFMPNHAHTATVTDPGHNHDYTKASIVSQTQAGGGGYSVTSATSTTSTATTSLSVAVNATGSGASGNMMPFIISFLPLIKT